MKKVFAAILVLALALTCLAACGGKTVDGSKLIIGGIGPLTGDYATYGVSVKQGAELAVKEINEAGGVNGIKLELKFEDDQVEAELAVNAYNLLMDDGMQVSLGGVTSGSCIAVAAETVKDGILMITPSGSQKECIAYDNCFRICFTDPDQGVYSARFIAENAIASKVAVIYDKSNDYSSGMKDAFVAEAGKVGLEVLTEQAFTNQSNTDFSVQLQQIKSSGAELVFLPIYAQEAVYVLTQAAQIDLDVIFFGGDGLDGVIQKIGAENLAATEGVMLLTPFAADATDAKTVAFTTAYKAAYNNQVPDQFAADGYDAIYTIAAALEKSGVTDTSVADLNEKLIAAMTQITVDGVTGSMVWGADGEPAKSATAVVIALGTAADGSVEATYKAFQK